MNKEDILVSVCCITYNHASYIRQCLDGFMMQKTDFKFEVLIHDDASTDGTEEIIREYEKKYPEVIKPLYEKENQWVQGRRGNKFFNYPRAIGKYIALCEGDDYWIDPCKLQKQVDFLEKNSSFIGVFHNAKVLTKKKVKYNFFTVPKSVIQTKELILYSWFVPTASIVFRNFKGLSSNPPCFNTYPAGDITLLIRISKFGKLKYINEYMSLYRFGIAKDSATSTMTFNESISKLYKYSTFLDDVNKQYFENRYWFYVFIRKLRIKLSIVKAYIKQYLL